MLLRLSALITLAASLYFLHRAADPIFDQNAKVRQWPPVEVTVLVTAPLAERPGAARDPATAGRFGVVYRHEVGGLVYRNLEADPRADDWMPAGPNLVTDGRGSYVRTARYNPERPAELFFPKALGLRDYLPVFFWSPLFALGLGGMMLRKPGRSAASPVDPAGKGWYRLRPKYSIRQRATGAWGVAVVCNFLLAAATFDYFTGEPRARSTLSNALVCLSLAPGLVTLGLAVYYSWMAGRVGEPKVSADAVRVRPGERLAVKIELPLRRGMDLERVRVSLLCIRTALESGGVPKWNERTVYEDHAERDVGRRASAATTVNFEQRFRLPPEAQPSSISRGGWRGPWIDWYVEVQFHLDHGPDYRGRFPIAVGGA